MQTEQIAITLGDLIKHLRAHNPQMMCHIKVESDGNTQINMCDSYLKENNLFQKIDKKV